MLNLPVKTYKDVMALNPCYDLAKKGYITRKWRGTALDVLKMEKARAQDRIWIVCHKGWLPDRLLHEFAIWCAKEMVGVAVEAVRAARAIWVFRAIRAVGTLAGRFGVAWAVGAAWAVWMADGPVAGAAAWDAQIAELIWLIEVGEGEIAPQSR